MAVEDDFPIPSGDPAKVLAMGHTLNRIAADVGSAGKSISAEQAGMAAVWLGTAGMAAATETSHAGTITADYGRRVGAGGTALKDYGDALAHAIDVAQGIRKSAFAEYDSAVADVNEHRYVEPARSYGIQSLIAPTMSRLGAQYHHATDRLRQAADRAATALTNLVPFYLPGMNLDLLAELARSGTAFELPMLQRVDGVRIGTELAGEVKPYLDQGKEIPDDALAEIERNRLNPWFAKTFLEELGSQAPLLVVTHGRYQGLPAAYNQRVITVFGDLLALGTRTTGPARLSDQYVDDLLTPLDDHSASGGENAWFLSHYLALGGLFGRDFLKKFGDKLDGLDRDGGTLTVPLPNHVLGFPRNLYFSKGYSLGQEMAQLTTEPIPNDPFENYFHALSYNPDAAQDFFIDADRLRYYVVDRTHDTYGERTGGGKSLGEALVAATTVFRNSDESGKRSAQIAVGLLGVLGGESHFLPDDRFRTRLLPALATILNSYADDIYSALSRRDMGVSFVQDASLPPGVRLGDKQLGTRIYGINLTAPAIRQVLGQVDHDIAAYTTVLQAQLDAANRFLDADLAYIRSHPSDRAKVLQAFGSGYGRVLDTLFNAHIQVQLALDHRENQEVDQSTFVKFTSIVVGTNVANSYLPFLFVRLGAPLAVTGSFGAFLGIVMPWVAAAALRPSVTNKREVAALQQLDAWWMDNQLRLIDQMQNGGAFAGTHADANTWIKQHGIPPEAKFTDADGKLLPMAKISENPARFDAYLHWHADEDRTGLRLETADLADAIESQVNLDPPKIG